MRRGRVAKELTANKGEESCCAPSLGCTRSPINLQSMRAGVSGGKAPRTAVLAAANTGEENTGQYQPIRSYGRPNIIIGRYTGEENDANYRSQYWRRENDVLIFILVFVTHVHTTNIPCMQTLSLREWCTSITDQY